MREIPRQGGYCTVAACSVTAWPLWVVVLAYLAGCAADPKPPALPLRSEPQQCFVDLGLTEPPPALISESGCFVSTQEHVLSPDVVPYGVNSALWTDGAEKYRYIVLPLDEQVRVDAKGIWQFPLGSIIVKEFGFLFDDADASSERMVETRFMQAVDEGWRFFSYRWREDGSEADLVHEMQIGNYTLLRDGNPTQVGYMFPDEKACGYCHSEASGKVLGPTNEQLNGVFDYGHRKAQQIDALLQAGYVDEQTLTALEPLPSLPDPTNKRLPIEERAKSYLHANCSHCHQPGGWTSPNLHFDMRYTTAFEDMGLCNEPSQSLTAYAYPLLLVPGAPEQSALLARIDPKSATDRMPPIGVSVTDPLAVELLTAWISGMQSCP